MTKILQFTAPWCAACKLMDAVLAGLPGVEKIDLDEQPEKAAEYDIKTLPTVIIVKDGTVHKRYHGIVSRAEIVDTIG